MSDIRFVMIGIVVITAGFIILGVYGSEYTEITVQTDEFSTCYEYSNDNTPVEIDCQEILQNKTLLFVGIASIIGIGILLLIKGVRGTWDQDVKPEEMLGPGGDKNNSDNDKRNNSE
tara:strand:+ start:52 stop:402 length:351 start_codon:yes stop_codon:yes gene_type:complete